MARSELEVVLSVVDKGSGVLARFKKSFTELNQALELAKKGFAALKKGYEIASEGASLRKAEKSFASMAKSVGQDIHKIANAMVEASGEALSMQESMEMASQAIRLGVAQTPEEFAKLTRAATNLGAAMGRGPVEAMGDIVRGIGRMSPLILDNIGIMTNGGQVFEDYAEEIGKTAKELTDAEKKQALLNLAIRDGNTLVDAAATGFEKLDAATKDAADSFKKELGRALEPVAEVLAFILRHNLDLNDAMDMLNYTTGIGGVKFDQLRNAVLLTDEEIIKLAKGLGDINTRVHDFGRLPPIKIDIEGPSEEAKEEVFKDFADTANEVRRIIHEINVGQRREWEEMMSTAGPMGRAFDTLSVGVEKGMEDAALEAAAVAVGAGDATAWGAAVQHAKDFGGPISEAYQTIKKIAEALANMPAITTGGPPPGIGGEEEGPGGQHGGTFTVPPGYPNDSFPARFSSGERVSVQNDERSYFGNSTVNINNGTGMDAFEEILRNIQ